MQRNFWLFLALIVFLGASTSAQQAPLAPLAPTNSPSAKAPLKIPVWVEKDEGVFWNEGKRQAFKVFLEDKEVTIKSFQTPQSGSILLIVFDTVADLTRVEEARTALQDALKDLNDQYWIGLLRAQDGLSVLQEPTADRAVLKAKIQALEVNGKAGLLDTVEPVSQLATAILQKAAVRVSVLYVTDGGIGHYRADYLNPVINSSDAGDLSRRFSDRAVQERISHLAQSLTSSTVPLFILHLERRSDTLNLAYQSGLERIAADSGGQAVLCRTTDEIRPALQNLIHRIRASYVVTVDPTPMKRQAVKVRIEAQNADGSTFHRVTHINQLTIKKK